MRWDRQAAHHAFLDHQAALAGSWEGISAARLGKCGRTLLSDVVELKGRLVDSGATAYYAGVVACGSVWGCPVCSAVIRGRRSMEVELAALRWTLAGGSLAMLTTTIRHGRRDPLARSRRALSASWRTVQQRKSWRRLRADSIEHVIHGLEVTWGSNGWHPHRHSLLFVRPGLDVEAVTAELAGWLPASWQSAVVAQLGKGPSLAHGVRVQALDHDAAGYVSKIADEHTRADLKTDSRNPFALLDRFADGEAQPIAMWCEYVAAMKGARAIVMSPGLRDELLGDVDDLDDEELAQQDVDGQVLELVPADVYRRWRRLRNEHGVIEALARLEGWERRLLAGPVEVVR